MYPSTYNQANAYSSLSGFGSSPDLSKLNIGATPSPALSIPKNSPLSGGNFSLPTPAPTTTNTGALTGSPSLSSPTAPAVTNFLNGLKPTQAPVSPVTKNAIGTFGGTSVSGAPKLNPVITSTGGITMADESGNTFGTSGFSIDTSAPITSDILNSNITSGNVNNAQSQYAEYVQALAKAQGYSPDYIAAYQAKQNADLNNAAINNSLYTNPQGDTADFARGTVARANASNQLSDIAATNSLNTQALIRTGNIAGAQSLEEAYKPTSVSPGASLVSPVTGQASYGGAGAYSDYQAQQTYFNLAQNFPDAQVPAYNPQLSAQQNLQIAQQAASQAPSFQARNIVSVQLPGGGIGYVNKNQIVTDPKSGIATIISPANATAANAYSANIKDLSSQQANLSRAVGAAESNFPLLLSIMKKGGVNDYNSPLGNQLQQALNNRLIGSGDYAAYQALTTSLATEYSQIFARGGTPTNQTRTEGETLLAGGQLGYTALSDLYSTLQDESKNVLNSYTDTINKQNQQLNNIYSSGQPLGTGGGTSAAPTGSSGTSGGYISPSQASW